MTLVTPRSRRLDRTGGGPDGSTGRWHGQSEEGPWPAGQHRKESRFKRAAKVDEVRVTTG